MKLVIRGSVAGLIRTALTTGIIFLGKKPVMAPGELAPKQIAESLEKKIGVHDRFPRLAFEVSCTTLHLGYGMVSGAAYALA